MLEGQELLGSVAEREKRLLKRAILKQRHKLLKHGNDIYGDSAKEG
ncbi:hypothetical protein L798_10622 [Zootermopsis nevadensis]|uniref:Uncharacterized protein n=1 Tax=Zootermopsis nevadensis TaxID=136037 RepID=A0A067R9M1_ZOONE|nr:hypothetical protein L798_10622 [Zootermopsis nevadensis]